MALTFHVGNIANHEHVTTRPSTRDKEDQEWHPVTDALVWSSIVCGYNHITEANYKEVAARLAQYQAVIGGILGYQIMPKVNITEEDVRMHIGLTTNASTLTKAQWRKKIVDMVEREAETIQHGRRNTCNLATEIKRDSDSYDKGTSAYEVCERMYQHYSKEKVDG